MEIKAMDPRDNLKILLEDYKITPYTIGLISGLDEKTIWELANHKNDLVHLTSKEKVHIMSMIGVLSAGMTLVSEDERVKAIIEVLHTDFRISAETLALFAKIETSEIEEFTSDPATLPFEKRYRLAVVVLFLFKVFSDNREISSIQRANRAEEKRRYMYTDQEVTIRPITGGDLPRLWELIYKDEQPEWKKWDAPYYPHKAMSYEEFLPQGEAWIGQDHFWAIEVKGVVRGIVSYYWEHEPSNWLEIGIVFHEAGSWGKGLGTKALRLWINHLFTTMPLVRVGFSTWSGNKRMIRVGEKLGMQLEARIRKARYYEGHYYDSIRMGILRKEWEDIKR